MTSLEWGLPVVAKYLFGGLSAGAFVTYYMWQGLGIRKFRPLAKLAWISAAVWGLAIPIPIFSHLGQPGRFPNLLTDIHWHSPMSWAGPILIAYIVVVLVNGRFFFLPDVVLAHRAAKGLRRLALRMLLITKPPETGVPTPSQFGLKVTGAMGFVLVLFFGYSGLELGIIPGKPLWANPINPLMFLLTGVISGMAFVVLLWIALDRTSRGGPEENAVLTSLFLPALIALFLGLNAISYASLAFAPPEVRPAVDLLATGELAWLFVGVGLVAGAAVPMVLYLLNGVVERPRSWLAAIASLLVLLGAFAQKYGFLVAGQYYSAPAGETYGSVWPASAEVIEFVAILALVYFLFVVALWVSPWRRVQPAPPAEPAPPQEVAA